MHLSSPSSPRVTLVQTLYPPISCFRTRHDPTPGLKVHIATPFALQTIITTAQTSITCRVIGIMRHPPSSPPCARPSPALCTHPWPCMRAPCLRLCMPTTAPDRATPLIRLTIPLDDMFFLTSREEVRLGLVQRVLRVVKGHRIRRQSHKFTSTVSGPEPGGNDRAYVSASYCETKTRRLPEDAETTQGYDSNPAPPPNPENRAQRQSLSSSSITMHDRRKSC
ncbi:hypothetical protein BJ138DRAFT_1118534 [Hygrophoropsis aurantiaca]|uniref:Uncharacterized protein n=1 Tax=Hygrophoropsis aurantiaca TaxID=72124 RepID=A0ACB7ZWA5_9AGAM|nr:hypothetical protein BJ138DRAFT_1118534 [Hygrophoropsis aurantiaca]